MCDKRERERERERERLVPLGVRVNGLFFRLLFCFWLDQRMITSLRAERTRLRPWEFRNSVLG